MNIVSCGFFHSCGAREFRLIEYFTGAEPAGDLVPGDHVDLGDTEAS